MKLVPLLLCLLFTLFALVQYNDPDGWLWIVLYGYIAVLSALVAKGKATKWMIGIGLGVYLIGVAILLPDFIQWLRTGAESIMGSMKAEKPAIELTREFLGLLICLLVTGWYWKES